MKFGRTTLALVASLGLELLPGAQGTLVEDIRPSGGPGSPSSDPAGFAALRGRIVFAATTDGAGREPWVSDGTAVGTVPLADIHPTGSSLPHDFVEVDDRLLFLAVDETSIELWATNATPGGTQHVADVAPALGSSAGPMVSTGALAWFFVETPGGNELWKSDGTAAGTELVTGVGTLPPTLEVAVFQGELYFTHTGAFAGSGGLWKSDGTAAGTVHVLSPWDGVGGEPRDHAMAGGQLFFTALTPDGRELWRTDGSAGGTILLRDIDPGSASSDPQDLVPLDDGTLLFTARSASFTNGLWKSDGTPAGTLQVVAPGAVSSVPGSLISFGDAAWFVVPRPAQDPELWSTDGTEGGTFVLNPHAAFTGGFRQAGSGKLLAWTGLEPDPGAGLEPFVSNGRLGGTVLVSDVLPGTASSNASGYTRAGSRIFFSADDGVHGTELHAFDLTDHGGFVAEPFGRGCGVAGGGSFLIDGRMVPGANIVFEFKDALPSVPVAVLYSPGVTLVAVGPCDYYLPQAALVALGTTDACGELSLPRTVPNAPGLIGNVVTIQALVVSSGGPFLGVGELTNPTEVVIGP